jgi:hypothetical protein
MYQWMMVPPHREQHRLRPDQRQKRTGGTSFNPETDDRLSSQHADPPPGNRTDPSNSIGQAPHLPPQDQAWNESEEIRCDERYGSQPIIVNDAASPLWPEVLSAKGLFDAQDVPRPEEIDERIRERIDPFSILKTPPGESKYQVPAPPETHQMPQGSSDPGDYVRDLTHIEAVMIRSPKPAARCHDGIEHRDPDEAPQGNAEPANVVELELPLFLDDGIYPATH